MARAPWQITKVSRAGRDFIKQNEGCRLTVYADVGMLGTVGYGHRTAMKMGTKISQDKADQLFDRDVSIVEKCIDRTVTANLTQDQFDAIADFIFNVGCKAFAGSMLRYCLNNGDFRAVPEQLLYWINAGGHYVRGLDERRKRETRLFEGR